MFVPLNTVSSQLKIVPCFQYGGTLSQTGFQREYANYENGLWGQCNITLLSSLGT